MNNDKSYKEIMKSQVISSQKGNRNFVKRLYVEMLLNEVVLKKEKENLMVKIDKSLDTRDKKAFIKLTNELVKLNKKFGA